MLYAIILIAIAFMFFLYGAVGRRVWRGESALQPGAEPDWWPFGEAAWQGVHRSWVAAVPCMIVMFMGFAVAEQVDEKSSGYDAAMAVSLLGFVAGIGLILTVTLWNRPRAVVPPHLRSEPGALAARRPKP